MTAITIELQMLVASVILGLFQILLAAHFATLQRGLKWNLSSRDQDVPPLKGAAGRIHRAAENFKETFPFFLAAVVIVQFLGKNNSTSALGAQIYFFARLIYVPIYAFNITLVRSAIWLIATCGIVITVLGAFV